MTEAMYYVLLALIKPGHGYKLMGEIEQVSMGRMKMGPGTLYGVLTRLQNDKMIEVLEDDGRKKVYKITEKGKKALGAEFDRIKNMVADGQRVGMV